MNLFPGERKRERETNVVVDPRGRVIGGREDLPKSAQDPPLARVPVCTRFFSSSPLPYLRTYGGITSPYAGESRVVCRYLPIYDRRRARERRPPAIGHSRRAYVSRLTESPSEEFMTETRRALTSR